MDTFRLALVVWMIFFCFDANAQLLRGLGSFKPGAAITTSIKDSLPAFRNFDDADFDPKDADSVSAFTLKPGYYRTTIRSYCLHAGAYGASKGNGYQIAKLKGNQSALITSILNRSAEHPDIPQTDVQMLIWGIEAGQAFSDYPLDYQQRIKPLLTEKDMALMEVKPSRLAEKLAPSGLKDMITTFQSLREKMNKAQMNYDEIESVAVKAGIPPTGLGSVEIKKGLWSYIGDGFFIRVYPESYTTTGLEIYRPGHFVVKKDEKGRITSFCRDKETVTIEYDEDPGADLFTSKDHPSIPIWRFRRFTYTNAAKGVTEEVRNKGWILRGPITGLDPLFASTAGSSAATAPTAPSAPTAQTAPTAPTGTPALHGPNYQPTESEEIFQAKESINWSDVYARYKEVKKDYGNAKEAADWAKRINDADKLKDYDEYLNEKAAQEMIAKGLKAASNPTDFKKKMDWIADLIKMDRDLMYWIDCQLAGSCSDSNDPKTPDLPSKVGQPGDAAAQRLGLSPVKKLPMYKP